MNFDRIASVMSVMILMTKQVTVVGTGAAVSLITDLARCGISQFRLVDPDVVGVENISRQGHDPDNIGLNKVDVVRQKILEINPDASVETIPLDLTQLPDDTVFELVEDTDLFLATTDSFKAQAHVNRMALATGVPAVFVGIYPGGTGGEVIWTDPEHQLPCFRCLCPSRYAAHEQAASSGNSLDPSSVGADIFSVRVPDAIAGQIVVGLLTRGADDRYGRLMDHIGDRQFLQISMSPEFQVNGRDIVRERLSIPAENDTYVAWAASCMSDPDQGQLPCPDCAGLRGHSFEQVDGVWRRQPSVNLLDSANAG